MKTNQNQSFDAYAYYLKSVQSPKEDVLFLRDTYLEINQREPRVLSEHFCGTFVLSCEWVKLNQKNQVCAVDIDEEPLSYGRKHYFSKLNASQKKRIFIKNKNVLDFRFKSDLIVVLNFSYFIFKERALMKKYFSHVFSQLKKNGLFIVDVFGGSECHFPNEEETVFKDFSYFWDQMTFDPISNESKFSIHFKRKNERKRKNVFFYDWRMWSIPELKDLMKEVGFKETYVYWEKDGKDGEGSGEFYQSKKGEACLTWVAYLVGKKP